MPSLLNNLDLNTAELNKISDYIDLLYKFDKSKRLIGSQNKEEWLINNIEDSIIASRLLKNEQSFYDMGSGNGLPGIILSILFPNSNVTLVDIDSKKCEFLKTAAFRLQTPCKIINISIEKLDLSTVPRGTKFIFRAFSPKKIASEFISKNKEHGHIVFLSEEQNFGLEFEKVENYSLSNGICRRIGRI